MGDDKKEVITVESQMEELKDKISTETDLEQLKNVVGMFNLNIKKKEILRKGVISDLQDKAVAQIGKRITDHPDEFSNKDLLDYTKTFKELLEKDNSIVDADVPTMIQLNPTQININMDNGSEGLNRESRQKVADVVKAILEKTQKKESESNIIDADVKKIVEEEDDNG